MQAFNTIHLSLPNCFQALDGLRIFAAAALEAFKTDCKNIYERSSNESIPDDVFCIMDCNNQGTYVQLGVI